MMAEKQSKASNMIGPLALLMLAGLVGLLIFDRVSAQTSTYPNLGSYGKRSGFCGTQPIPRDAATIPQIGCFYLSAGHSAAGTFSTHHVILSVDNSGTETFTVDGTVAKQTPGTAAGSNLPYAHGDGSGGFQFCKDATDGNHVCPVSITPFSRNRDKSVLFMVSQYLPDRHYSVSTQENWDYEKSRQQGKQ